MKAIGHFRYGGPEVLEVVQLPDPVPSTGEVLIRVRAVGVSPTDTLRRAGLRSREMEGEPTPHVPGMELAGTVEQVGPATLTDLEIGQHVMGALFPRGTRGAYSELVALPVESVVSAPSGVDDTHAATILMNGLTARMTLDRLNLQPGQKLGVTGAAGTYGAYVVQMAKADGLFVVADASADDHALVASFGADAIVPRGDDVGRRFLEVCPGGLDGLADGALLNEKVVASVRPGGGMVTLRYFEDESNHDVTFHPIKVRYYLRERAKLLEVRQLVEDGKVWPRVACTFPAHDAAEAHRLLERGGIRGRIVLTFNGG